MCNTILALSEVRPQTRSDLLHFGAWVRALLLYISVPQVKGRKYALEDQG